MLPDWLLGKCLHYFGKVLFGVGSSSQILELCFTAVCLELRVCSVGLITNGRHLVHDTTEADTGCVGNCNGFKEAPSECGAIL